MSQLWLIAGLIISGTLAQVFMSASFSIAPAVVITPVGYTGLIWAVLFDYIIWSKLPDLWTLAGAALIIACALFILLREHKNRNAH